MTRDFARRVNELERFEAAKDRGVMLFRWSSESPSDVLAKDAERRAIMGRPPRNPASPVTFIVYRDGAGRSA